MNTLIIYYSYTGHAEKTALELAKIEEADIVQIEDESRPGKLKAYTVGCFGAIFGKEGQIKPIKCDLSLYERFILVSPVWAGSTPPAVNTVLHQLPQGKEIIVKMVSMSGKSECKNRLEKLFKVKDCILVSFEDIRA